MKIASKDITAVSLVTEAYKKAEQYADYHAFISLIDKEEALKKAAAIDKKIKNGEPVGRLAGVPFATKDNYLSPEGKSTAAAHILDNLESPITATAIKKLEDEGAIMIGRANLDAFAHGSSTENSYFGATKNAANKEYVAGGSSGGSAVAVALDIVEFATGTDTGGSVRCPAAFNGIYGIKPTYGTISRYGVVAMASSLDVIGFFAKSPEDIDLLMSVTAGQDPYDLTTLPDYYDQTEEKPVKTIGVINDLDNDTVNPEIRAALKAKCDLLKEKGYEIKEVEMPSLKYALAAYYIICPAEVTSNLSRYDGVRYGFRSENIKGLDDLYQNTRGEGFMAENKRRIMIGNFVLSSGFYDAYFLKAAKARTVIINEYNKAFEECDFLLTPVGPNPAFKIGENASDPIAMYLEDAMTVPINLAGIPGLAIPAGKTKEGLPIGLQLLGPRRSDKNLIKFAKELA